MLSLFYSIPGDTSTGTLSLCVFSFFLNPHPRREDIFSIEFLERAWKRGGEGERREEEKRREENISVGETH